MQPVRRHIILVFLLSLVLLYSTPVKSLHNCSNLNHHSNELAFEDSHEDCLICGLQYYPYIPANLTVSSPAVQYDTVFNTPYTGAHYNSYSNSTCNRGPPALD
jgi:hypothetical protein